MVQPRKIMLVTADRAERGLQEPILLELCDMNTKARWCQLNSHARHQTNLTKFEDEVCGFQPDIVMVPTDRNEMVYIAAHAFHMGLIVAHFHAGNNPTNHPDDLNRRAISCFSHILFCNMKEHRDNLIRQGEEPKRIHVVGSTAFDNLQLDDAVTPKDPFDLVILHPNPLSRELTEKDLVETMRTIEQSHHVVWIYPNHDIHYDVIQQFLDSCTDRRIIKYTNLPRAQYFSLLKNCRRAVGNSSSFYYEMPILDADCCHTANKLIQIGERNKGLIVPETVKGGAKRIANILATIPINDELRRKRLTNG